MWEPGNLSFIIGQPQCPVVGRRPQACRLRVTLSCAVLCQVVSLQYLFRSSLHRLAGLPCRLFLSFGLQVVTREVHRLSLRRLICPAQDHFIFLTWLIVSTTCPLSYPDVGHSVRYVIVSIGPQFFPFWSVQRQVSYVLVWSVSRSLHHHVIAGSTHGLHTCLFR